MMKIVARAPARIDPAGGGTDAPPYSVEYGGCVVNIAVARYSYAQFQWLPPGSGAHVYSMDFGVGGWAARLQDFPDEGKLAFIRAFITRLLKGRNDFLLVTQSDIPVRTGLGGSGAMGVALTTVCTRAMGQELDQTKLALLANEIERHDLGFAGGSQDCLGAALGSVKKIVYRKGGGETAQVLTLPTSIIRRIERDMLLIYTGGVHLSATIHADIKRSYAMKNSPVVAAMDGLKAAAIKMAAALENDDNIGFIEALNASRRNHYALHESCDSDTLRTFFAKLQPYILAGKTSGAGGGGFIMVYAKPGAKHACIEAAEQLGGTVWPFKMDLEGVIAWEEAAWTPSEVAEFQARARG